MSWELKSLASYIKEKKIELQTGPFGTQLKASNYTATGTPVINVRNIGYGLLKEDKLEFVPDNVVRRLSKHILKKGDIVFARKGAVNRHLLVNPEQENWMQGSDCIRMRILSKDIIPSFLSFAMRTSTHQEWMIKQCSNKSTMASLNQDVIGRILIKIPNINEQNKIVSILSAYDDLIKNNRRRIQLLEESARLLYEEWFVRLRFPGHEHVKIVDGIPEGWEKSCIGEVTSFLNRGITPKYNDSASGIVINQKCIRNSKVDLSLARRQSKDVPSMKLVQFGDILINSTGTGTLGRIGQFLLNMDNCTVDSHVTIVRAQEKYLSYYLGMHLLSLENYIATLGRGSTNQTELSKNDIASIKINIPQKTLTDRFNTIIYDIFTKKTILQKQNDKLAQARDLLLPKLMNGEIRL